MGQQLDRLAPPLLCSPRCSPTHTHHTTPHPNRYVLARRFWRDPADGSLYACTKALAQHGAAPGLPGVVRMQDLYR